MLIGATFGVALVGCGGGGASSSDLPLADWQRQADAVCIAVRQEAEADQPVTGAGNPAVPIRARAVSIGIQVARIGDLGSPDEGSDTVDDLLDALARQAEALNELADALLADPTATSGTAGAALNVETDKVTAAATELGVPSCTPQASTDPTSDTPSSVDPSGGGSAGGGFGDQGQTQEG